MMTDDEQKCSHVCDCAALHEIATTKSNNLKVLLLDLLQNGIIAVPNRVFKEFRDIYEDEAAELKPYITKTIGLTRKYQAAAARIVDKTHSGFPRRPYDGDTDLYTAAIATVEGCVVLTTAVQLTAYNGMGCEVIDLASWIDELGTPRKKTG